MIGIVLYVTRQSWGDSLQDYIANLAHDAIHAPGPSEPSFIKAFAGGVAKKLIKLELNSL